MSTNPEQLTLISNSPIARKTDSAGSQMAAQQITNSGKRASQQHHILAMVRKLPGRTAQEYAALDPDAAFDRYVYGRRLPELAEAVPPLVKRGEKRKCTVTKIEVNTWWPAGGVLN